jgi:SpoVK/Ycf46/Vps4 family AAA+-type ATPase
MARSDLLKKLFRSFKNRNDLSFLDAARELAEEERRKHHHALADELLRILDNGYQAERNGTKTFDPLPKDTDRGAVLLEVSQPERYLSDLILTKCQTDLVSRVLREWREWDILEANGLRPSSKILFCGPSGCGKTATAQALSTEMGIPLVTVRFDAVVSSLLGETAANLRKVFDYIVRGSWVVLFDEFDAIGRSRDDPTEHGELKRVVNTFLQMLDRFRGRSLLVAATNYEQSLDPALWRRFDEVLRFELPDRAAVRRLLELKLRTVRCPSPQFDMATQRLTGMSHAELERVCLDVLKKTVLISKKVVAEEDFEEAIRNQEIRKQALARARADGATKIDEA